MIVLVQCNNCYLIQAIFVYDIPVPDYYFVCDGICHTNLAIIMTKRGLDE